ncbi:MAG: gliding motility-associated C-terminal domain-containing protein [Taibaiella sp.]|nr:gliding motility-associated C-terminal domain-containing protein [Taibaiella sp.]
MDWIGPNAAYVTLYITSGGPLNLLIDGNASNGFLDVAVFKIPTGADPCIAIQNTANQIGCNYASSSSGCVQFGTAFSCASSVAAPNVNAGDILMVVVENWSGASSNFTLSLGPGGAQSGSPTPTITSPANFCFRSQPVQLTTNHAGGTWSGPGVSASGLFNPSVAGSGTHTISYTIGVSPCQSTTSKVITVSAPLTGVRNVTICQGQSYVFNGISYTSNNNTAKDTFQTAAGCDSIVTLNLNVTPAITSTINRTICKGNVYNFGGTNYTSSQNGIQHTFQTPNGCDSIVTLNLTVTPPLTGTQTTTICQGQSYTFNGITYTSSNNTAKDTLQNAQGCDSIVTLNLTVNPYVTSIRNVTICQGQSYTFNGITYTSSNNMAKDTFVNQNGCDSIVTLNLVVNPVSTGTQNVTLCQGQSYTFNGITYASSNNTAKDTLLNQYGCDSIVTLNLIVNPVSTGIQTTTICQGQSYSFNGITYTSSNNTAKDTLLNQYGCDSIVTLNLNVTPAITNTINPLICQGNSYNFGGTVYTTAQTGIVHTFQTASGCDSIVTMNLTVNPPLTGTQVATICQGQSYTFNGITYTTSNNTAKDTLQNAQGCDSIVTLNLTVTPAITNTINPVICQGNSYTFAGTVYTTAQTGIVHTFQTAGGCDSIVTMNLTVSPPLTGTQTTTICQGQSYTFNGIVYTSSNNTAKDTLQNAQGCDSIVTLNLTVTPAITNTINPVICQGNSYNFGGTVYTTAQTGIVHNFPTAQGCDSIVTMNLTVSPPLTNTINPVICQGSTYTFAGTPYTTSQTGVVHTFQTAQGCDSIVTMNLTVNPITYGTQTAVRCQGQSFTFNGITYTSSNYTAKDTLVNQYGCDSIVTLNLTVNPVSSGTQTVTICQGHSYTFNGITYTAGNTTATDTLVNQYGCDSIVTLNLTVTPAPTTTLNDTICLGDSYTFGPHVFTTDQSGFVHNFPTAQGCDSLVTLNLTVLNIVPQPLNIQQSGCDVVSFEGTDYTSSTIINDTLYSDFGCDSIYRHIEITVHKTTAYTQRIDTAGCDEVFVNGVRYTSDAQVSDTLKNQYGCDSVYRDFHIKIYQFQLELSFTPDDPYEMERIEFTTSSYYGNNYKVLSWSPATAFSDQDAKSQTASFTAPAQVVVRARSLDGGCEDEFRVSIDPREYSKEVAMPNAFSPNGDGLNDIFRPVLKLERAYNTMDFRIYNRYGQLVHATANMNHGWDGMYNGRPADNGMYSYKLVIYFLDGTNKVFTGEVSLVR